MEYLFIRKKLVKAAQRVYERYLIGGAGGNISARIPGKKTILISSTGIPLVDLREKDFVLVNFSGRVLSDKHKSSSELDTHLSIYKNRKDANAIIHSHPYTVTGLACADADFDIVLTEDYTYMKRIAIVPFFSGGSSDLAKAVGEESKTTNVIVIKNHGVMVSGHNLSEAFHLTELLEHYAKTYLVTRIIGKTITLPQDEIKKVKEYDVSVRYDDNRL